MSVVARTVLREQVKEVLLERILRGELQPGDLILTGTPSGVGFALDPPQFLQSGDVVRIEIEQLGAIEHAIA